MLVLHSVERRYLFNVIGGICDAVAFGCQLVHVHVA